MSKQRLWLVAGLGVTLALLLGAWLVMGWGGGSAVRAADDVGLLAFAGFATICCFLAARRATGRQRRMWLALGGGLAAWSAGELIWCYYELWQGLEQAPFPSPADAAFLLFPVGATAALILLPDESTHQSRWRLILDGLIVAGSLFTVSWVAVLSSVFHAGAGDAFALSVSMAYPLADLVLITMVVMVLARAHTTQRASLALLTAGIALMSFSDSVFAYLTATDPYKTGNLIDLGWLVAFLLFALAALSSRTEAGRLARTAPLPSRSRLMLPYLPVLLAGVVGARQALPLLGAGPVPAVGVGLVGVLLVRQFVTMSDNRRLLVTAAYQAFHDPLTGLANRALFNDRLERAVQLQQRDLRPLAVLMLDLDGFKSVNDRFGHAAGDELLIRVSERMVGCLRVSDTIARLGGDEFAALIEQDGDGAILATQRVQDAFATPFMVDSHPLTVRPSIGLATASGHARDISAGRLLKQADLAMYQAKRNGAGAFSLFPTTRAARAPSDDNTPEQNRLPPSSPPVSDPTPPRDR